MPARSKPHGAAATALEIEQIEHLIRTTPVAWLLSMLGALICYVQFMEAQAGNALDWWFGAFCAVSLARLGAALFHVFARLVAPLSLLVPCVGMVAAALLLDEPPTSLQWLGSGLVLLGFVVHLLGGKMRLFKAQAEH